MTLIDPTRFPSIPPIDPLAAGFGPYPDVQPFSARAGIGYQDKLEAISKYLTRTVYPYLRDSNPQTVWDANTDLLVAAVQTQLDAALADLAAGTIAVTSAGMLAAFEAANSATLGYLDGHNDGRYLALSTFPVTPEQFGAVGDGITDDTAAFAAALATGRPVQAIHQYAVTGLDNSAHNSPIRGLGWNSKIIALPGTGTLYRCVQNAGQQLSDIAFEGRENADVCVDTSWTIPQGGAAPSLNSHFRYVRVNGYKVTGWKAQSNNDSPFDHVVIESSAGATAALDLQAFGGMVELNNCKILGPFLLGCQQANILGGFFFGVEITGADYNLLSVHGGYWYANSHGTNVWVRAGAQIQSPGAWFGVHIENSVDAGALYGGDGAIQGVTKLTNCHLHATNGATVKVLQPSVALGSLNGVNASIVLDGCFNEGFGVQPDANPAISVSENDSTNYGNLRGSGKRTVTIGAGGTAVVTQLPRAGVVLLRMNSGASEFAVYAYNRSTDPSQAGTVQALFGAPAGFTFTIPAGSNGDPDSTDASIHNAGTVTDTFELVVLGF